MRIIIYFFKKNKVANLSYCPYSIYVNFLQNSLTRRTVVQIMYRNYFSNFEDFFLEDEFISDNIGNRDLYIKLMNKCSALWNDYKKIFDILVFEEDLRSLMAISILKVFVAELLINETNEKILFKEYLLIANSFCPDEGATLKVYFNKSVEENLKEKDFTSID